MLKSIIKTLLILTCLLLPTALGAQVTDELFRSDHAIDPSETHQLSLEIDNVNFFKNNEMEGNMEDGYGLPGFNLQVKLSSQPLRNIRLEGGIYVLRFWGANKYPNYAYQDIETWKGEQFQRGFHLLPVLRAQVEIFKNFQVVFGTLYGGANHRLIEPIYSPELNLTADPETGLQLLFDSRHFDADVWINWESFIFRQDLHQEVFTTGVSLRVKYTPEDRRFHLYTPLQILMNHRGGEFLSADNHYEALSFFNAAAGLGGVFSFPYSWMKSIRLEADAVIHQQTAGNALPYKEGNGFYAKLEARLGDFTLRTSYWDSWHFITLHGNTLYGSLSKSDFGYVAAEPSNYSVGLAYSKSFGKGFTIGADIDFLHTFPTRIYTDEFHVHNDITRNNFFMGAYLRINPSFLLKQF